MLDLKWVCVYTYTYTSIHECVWASLLPGPTIHWDILNPFTTDLCIPFQTYKTEEHSWGKKEFLQTALMFHRLDFCGFFLTSFSEKQDTK